MNTQETFPPQTPYEGFEAAAQAAPVHEALKGGVEYTIDPSMPLARDERYGCDISAVITADRRMAPGQTYKEGDAPDSFVIADLRRIPIGADQDGNYRVFNGMKIAAEANFLLLSKDYQPGSGKGLKGIRVGETVTIGRHERTSDRFNLNRTTSGTHFSISHNKDGRLTIIDHNSTNGTSVSSASGVRERVQWQSRKEQEEAFRPPHEEQPQQPRQEQPKQQPENPYGFDAAQQRKFGELQKLFDTEINKGDIDGNILAGLLKQVGSLRAEGLVDEKIFKRLARQVHPDLANPGSAEYARRSAMYKALTNILNK